MHHFRAPGARRFVSASLVIGVAFVVAAFNAVFSLPFERVCRWALSEPRVVR